MQQEIIKKLKKDSKKCSYPGCDKPTFMNVMLPVGKMTESGMIEFPQETKDGSVQSAVPLCNYHFVFVSEGLLNLVEDNGMIRLVGPYPIIDIVEKVIRAKEIEGRLKKQPKKKKKK